MLNADDFVVGKDEIGRSTVGLNPDKDMIVIVKLGETKDGTHFKSNYTFDEIKDSIHQGKTVLLLNNIGIVAPCTGLLTYESIMGICFTWVVCTNKFPFEKCVINYWLGVGNVDEDYPFTVETIKLQTTT